jgi:hypothetical protein
MSNASGGQSAKVIAHLQSRGEPPFRAHAFPYLTLDSPRFGARVGWT